MAKGDGKDRGEVLRGRKTPEWSCGNCGRHSNWASRIRCACGRNAPESIIAKARAEDKRVAAAPPRSGTSAAAGNGTSGSSAADAKLRRAQDELKKARESIKELERKVASSATLPLPATGADDEADNDATDVGQQIEHLQKQRDALAEIPASDAMPSVKLAVADIEARLASLREKRLAAKPAHTQRRILEEKVLKAERALTRIDEDVAEQHRRKEEADSKIAGLRDKKQEIAVDVAALRAKLQALNNAATLGDTQQEHDVPIDVLDSLPCLRGANRDDPRVAAAIAQLGPVLAQIASAVSPPPAEQSQATSHIPEQTPPEQFKQPEKMDVDEFVAFEYADPAEHQADVQALLEAAFGTDADASDGVGRASLDKSEDDPRRKRVTDALAGVMRNRSFTKRQKTDGGSTAARRAAQRV